MPAAGAATASHPRGVNENQGAESTLSYLTALLAVYNLRGLTGKSHVAAKPMSEDRSSWSSRDAAEVAERL